MDLRHITGKVAALSAEVAAFIRTESLRFTEANVESKGQNNLVSYVDTTAEQRFVAGLSELVPQAG
ncbi:MAG TPA: hypothetical protein PL106_10955, partial [Flavobacteriales bacterium]|nr:hypothetical protein [Flavobacteriales bacterium]